ncbi:MAG: PIG-L family deacetylase [Kordiimonadaceae bacterium]|nr:PIG-L family deacetylase [Kordiimonadaceae bacterium]MBT6031694.1 PIG-L family deacetylase [Kordiimonadaceae bacterium]
MLGNFISKIFVLVIAVLAFVYITRMSLYPYDVNSDYHYNFADKNAITSELEMKNGVISFVSPLKSNQTSFLKIVVKGSMVSHFLNPSLTVSNKTASEKQFFEHGASGIRYINVTNLINGGENLLSLEGKNLIFANGKVDLVQFENVSMEGKRVLVLAPHPDDAEIGAFGLYNKHDEVFVVTVTAGDAGGFMYDEIYEDRKKHYLKKGEVRTWNSLSVPHLGGVVPDRTVNLGFFDATIKAMATNKSLEAESLYIGSADINLFRKQNVSPLANGLTGISNWPSLVDNLAYIVNEIKPDIIVTPSPQLDNHSDHQYVTHALVEAMKKIDKRDGHLFLYTNHFILNEPWPYGDAGSVRSLPPSPEERHHFSSVYSHPLTKEEQQSKEIALDAMNDLRLGTDHRYIYHSFKSAILALWEEIKGNNQLYFRRAVRSNELFFVIKTEEIYQEGVPERL